MKLLLLLLNILVYIVYGVIYDIGVPCGKDQTNYDPYTAQVIIKGNATSMASVLELVLFNDFTVESTPLNKSQKIVIIEGNDYIFVFLDILIQYITYIIYLLFNVYY